VNSAMSPRQPIPLFPDPPFSLQAHTRRNSDLSYCASDYESDFPRPPFRILKSTPERPHRLRPFRIRKWTPDPRRDSDMSHTASVYESDFPSPPFRIRKSTPDRPEPHRLRRDNLTVQQEWHDLLLDTQCRVPVRHSLS
jgi:hypothetical protein